MKWFLISIVNSQIDRFFSVVLCLLILIFWFAFPSFSISKRGKMWWWFGNTLIILGISLTVGLHFRKLPRGLSGAYYDKPFFVGETVQSLRYFETPGQRVDRFIDFNPNDFDGHYPFSGKPFSVKWQGYVYLPVDMSHIGVESNFATSLSIDEVLVQRPPVSADIGTPDGQISLGKGWSYDQSTDSNDSNITYVWSSGDYSDLYLGIDEIADYSLSFRCLQYQYPGSPTQHITVSVNGVTRETITLKKGWTWETYRVFIPQTVVRRGGTGSLHARFFYSAPIRPADVVDGSHDKRKVAVALDSVGLDNVEEDEQTLEPILPLRQHDLFKRGVHKILLEVQGSGDYPFIRLVWRRGKEGVPSTIPEDHLLPESVTLEHIRQKFLFERVWLGLLIIYKCVLILLLGTLLVQYVIHPYLQNLHWETILHREVIFVGGLLFCAFLIRLFFLLEKKQFYPAFHILPQGTDQLTYVFFARGFFRGYWPGLSYGPFYFGPLISFYFILCSILFGESLLTIRVVTAVLSTGTMLFVFLIARQAFNRRIAYISAVLCACNGVLIFYDSSLLIAPLLTFLSLFALWLSFELKTYFSYRVALMLGMVIGLAALARSTIFLLMPFLFLWMLIGFPGSIRQKISRYLVLCIMMLVMVLPVTLRNYYSNYKHQFVLTTSGGGENLWIGNNPSSTGVYGFSGELLDETRKRMKETNRSYSDEVFRYIREQPVEYLRLEYEKLKMFWRGYEIGNLLPYYFFRQHYAKILQFPWLNFVLIGPLSILGMILAIKTWKESFMLYGFIFVQIVITLLFFSLARYRIPAVPVLSIFAAYTIYTLFRLSLKRHYVYALILFLAFVGLYVGINYPYAAAVYEQHYQTKMPFSLLFRYWELFHFHVPY